VLVQIDFGQFQVADEDRGDRWGGRRPRIPVKVLGLYYPQHSQISLDPRSLLDAY
jgi:hypothetical protein